MSRRVYCFDTSSLLEAGTRAYPSDVFESLWRRLDGLIEEARFLAPIEVLRELKRRDDAVHAWARARERVFVRREAAGWQALAKVAKQCGTDFVNPESDRHSADPMVVALAVQTGASVVSEETPRRPSEARWKIPDACRGLGIQCMRFLDVIRAERWQF
jgi:hypothetical protein